MDAKYVRRLYKLHQEDDDKALEKIANNEEKFLADEAIFICKYILKERSGETDSELTELLKLDGKESVQELKDCLSKYEDS